MKRNLILSVMLIAGTYAMACTNFIVVRRPLWMALCL